MKLTKENVYIKLRGKSKEELTDLWEFLTSNGEKCYRDLESFLEYAKEKCYLGYDFEKFFDIGKYNAEYKTKVTIEQLKEIIKPMENKGFEKLLNYAKSVDFKASNLPAYINEVISFDYYNQLEGDEPEDKAYLFTLKYKDIDLPLEQQLQKAEAEVKRLKTEIEESKIKVGDWCTFWNHDKSKFTIAKFQGNKFACLASGDCFLNFEKITDPELINKLNELIK